VTEAGLDRTVRLHIFERVVADGIPPTVGDAARALGMSEAEAEASYRRLAVGKVIVLVPGGREILMANPFAARPTDFRVSADRGRWYGNCAWDALGILSALQADGSVTTSCADCADPLEVAVQGGSPRGEAVLHIAVPARDWWGDIVFT
jgi:hypothetical protein